MAGRSAHQHSVLSCDGRRSWIFDSQLVDSPSSKGSHCVFSEDRQKEKLMVTLALGLLRDIVTRHARERAIAVQCGNIVPKGSLSLKALQGRSTKFAYAVTTTHYLAFLSFRWRRRGLAHISSGWAKLRQCAKYWDYSEGKKCLKLPSLNLSQVIFQSLISFPSSPSPPCATPRRQNNAST